MTRWGVLTCSRVCVVQASTRRTRESAEGHPGPASGSDKGGQLKDCHSRLLTACSKVLRQEKEQSLP